MLENAQTKAEFEEVLMLINEIQAGFNEIKSAENYIVVNNNIGDDLSKSTRERIASDMTLISNILKENREKINRLQKQLSNSQNESAQLKETINSLNEMMDEKTQIITNLQSELAKLFLKSVNLLSVLFSYGISTVTLKNLWSELVGYCQSPPFSNVSLPYTL